MAGLNEGASDGFKQATRMGGSPSLGVFAQMGRYRSAAVAPTLQAQGSERHQASIQGVARSGNTPSGPAEHVDGYRMKRALADVGVRILLGL